MPIGQLHVAVAHQFHCHAGGNAAGREQRAKGLAQGMQIKPPPALVKEWDASRSQVTLERWHARHKAAKGPAVGLGIVRPERLQGLDDFGTKEVRGRLAILRDRRRDAQPGRVFASRSKSPHLSPRESRSPQARVKHGLVDRRPMGRGDSKKPPNFLN